MAKSRIQMCAGGRDRCAGRCGYLRDEADEVGALRLVCMVAAALGAAVGYCGRVNKGRKREGVA